jgi:hypothetical protein
VASTDEGGALRDLTIKTVMTADVNLWHWNRRFTVFRHTNLDRHREGFEPNDEEAAAVLAEYEKQLRAKGLTDFDQMMEYGLRLVEDHAWVRRALHAKFPALVVDEYQDMVPALDRLVKTLCFKQVVPEPALDAYYIGSLRSELQLHELPIAIVTNVFERRREFRSRARAGAGLKRDAGAIRARSPTERAQNDCSLSIVRRRPAQ